MSLHYVIDGCNLVRHPLFPEVTPFRSQDSRAALVAFIARSKICGSVRNDVTIAFDGYAPRGFLAPQEYNITVAFSLNTSADELIRQRIQQSKAKRTYVVVTDDRELGLFIRALGADWRTVQEFLAPKLKKLTAQPGDTPKPELGYETIERINKELKKLWLT